MSAEVLPGHTFSSHVDHGMLRNAGACSTPQMRHISSPPSPHTMATSASSRPPFRRGSVIVNFVILQSPDCIPQLSPAFRDIPRHSVVTRLAFRLHSAAFRACCVQLFAALLELNISVYFWGYNQESFLPKKRFHLKGPPPCGPGCLGWGLGRKLLSVGSSQLGW